MSFTCDCISYCKWCLKCVCKRVLAASDAADCLIATYYYEAWCKIMMRKYQDAIDSLQEVLLYIERGRKTILNKDSQYKNDMLNKMQDKMFHMLAVCIILYPCRIDESLEQSMKEKVTYDKLTRMQGACVGARRR